MTMLAGKTIIVAGKPYLCSEACIAHSNFYTCRNMPYMDLSQLAAPEEEK
jgi:hypothetical protein